MENSFYRKDEIRDLIILAAAKCMAYHDGDENVTITNFVSFLFEQFEIDA